MKLKNPISVKWAADFVDAEIRGSENALIKGINEIHQVASGDISFVDFDKYYRPMLQSEASFILINKEVTCPEGKTLLITPEPFDAYIKLVKHFRAFEPAPSMINETSEIGEGTHIQPRVFLGNHVTIGKNCLIHTGTVIYDYSEIGDNVIIHGNAVIGADAFYYKGRKDSTFHYDKMESCGRVILEDNVEIGAATTIDKGVSGITRIGRGTKIDNHVHIGHEVIVGKNCLFAAQVGIAGTTIVEDDVTLWGQVGVNKDLVLGKGCTVFAQSGVNDNLEAGKTYFGSPAVEARKKMKELAWIKRIPEIWRKIAADKSH